jgi:hypothetical protein
LILKPLEEKLKVKFSELAFDLYLENKILKIIDY